MVMATKFQEADFYVTDAAQLESVINEVQSISSINWNNFIVTANDEVYSGTLRWGKIKAVACYKLDRISRKTSDLMRLLEYFERHDVTLLVCSNNINTRISTSKIIIQVLAIIAEFERDILTERIQDNLMELAKDGRWLGGKTPTGFSSQRVTTGSGKK